MKTTWTFKEAEEYLDACAPPGVSNYGLERINHLLDLLGHPEKGFAIITVAGTNGKGSTIAFLDSLLRAHGITTACHIKPHLESVTERIRINGIDSTESEFAAALYTIKRAVDVGWEREDSPTYFELIFAAFLMAAKLSQVKVVILEAGLGGRLDAVNSVDADIVLLSSVDFDHTELLGDTLDLITKEKIVIARPESTVVCQQNPPEVLEVVKEYCAENDINLRIIDDITFLNGIELGLKGPYQVQNACLAIIALESIVELKPEIFIHGSTYGYFEKGLKTARLPGRWEEILDPETGKRFILDGGHNKAGLKSVLKQFKGITNGTGTIIFALKKTKDHETILPMLLGSASSVIFTKPDWPECHDPEFLASELDRLATVDGTSSQIKSYSVDSIKKGIKIAKEVSTDTLPVLVTGSLYLVGLARSELIL